MRKRGLLKWSETGGLRKCRGHFLKVLCWSGDRKCVYAKSIIQIVTMVLKLFDKTWTCVILKQTVANKFHLFGQKKKFSHLWFFTLNHQIKLKTVKLKKQRSMWKFSKTFFLHHWLTIVLTRLECFASVERKQL